MGTLKFRKRYLLYLLPAAAALVCFFAAPFFQTLGYSLSDWDGIGEKRFIGLANYREMFQLDLFRASVGRVLKFALIQPLVQICLGVVFAYLLRGTLRGGRFFRSVFFMPVVISSAAISVMFTVMYDYDFGLFNTILRGVGLDMLAKPWLSTKETAFYAVMVVAIWQQIGMIFVILLSGMQGISEELFEAAEMDGAGALQCFFRIALPGVAPIIKICVVLCVSNALKNFDYVSIMTMGGPAGSSHVPATIMYDKAFVGFRWGLGSAISIFIFALGMAFTLVFNAVTREHD